ncbi:MAG: hypothetical protein E7167_03740 [Firmicutes bacterium]|nr:hypothetical protein [Bacillota bacterium]
MKKLFASLVILLGGMFLITGCGAKNVEGTLEEIMTKVYAEVPEDQRPMGLTNMKVTEENVEGFLGSADIKYAEALASESMVGSIAHSVVLLRTEEGADVEKVKEQISENVNPRKWICVGVEKEDVIIKNKGNLIIVVIVENEEARTKLEAGFDSL